ncbi:protein translocase subunit SecD [Ktedonosporobacter rubrisoli]|uniref:Protein translocase subunit SecD n=1 Tax=Ktedonosporobacter rubrisoli TaxID=2509675 RepID=A0A4P6JTJ6_KTERU|nr:protein translocase subunit SecD [Ktedonosporobacter rubrisoli]QBD78909.1 protein translocase subunit SecD [Ktedonosporobacter rubrisoli]
MRRGTLTLLFFIILLALGASYVVFWPNNTNGKPWNGISNPFTIKEGLDLQGGIQVVLVPADGQDPKLVQDNIAATRTQIEQRVNGGLGVNEPSVRIQTINGQPSIAVELPGLAGDQQQAIDTLLKTGNLEFWNTGPNSLQEGAPFNPADYAQYNPGGKALFTGKDLDPASLSVGQDPQTNGYVINFAMKGDAVGGLSKFTADHVNDFLTVTLDRKVVSSPRIQSQLPGSGIITGRFTLTEAQQLVNVLKYGALPIVLKIGSEETVGATLGADTINKSLLAGGIGLAIVVLFMLLYYRLPGFLADIALVLYSIFTFAIFKLIGVTLSLAGIAGFILSIGMAVDANVLIFERVKEELREGRLLASAIDIGWKRAWPSIRDSNFSTMITCAVLYFFGSNFGATIIVGFATTLFLGVVVSMFTAIIVTRTFLNLLVPTGVINHPALFGLPADSVMTTSLARRNSTV